MLEYDRVALANIEIGHPLIPDLGEPFSTAEFYKDWQHLVLRARSLSFQ